MRNLNTYWVPITVGTLVFPGLTRVPVCAEGDPVDQRLQRLKDARKFILAWGYHMSVGTEAKDFLISDPVMHYAYNIDKF